MIKYRLLRDNKETGPYSEEEMIARGFKPYDLLWAEGKSAGWQYPSEINAFKKYAPIVEEQPYDRFYKKQPAQKSQLTEERNSNLSSYTPQPAKTNEIMQPQQQQPAAARPAYNYNVQDLPARHIHVTLPSGNTLNLTALVAKKENKETSNNITDINKIPSTESLPVNAEKINIEKRQPSFAEIISLPQPIVKEVKQGAISVDINTANGYSKNDIATRPEYQASAAGFSWSLIAAAVIGIAAMVGLGVMIGLSMNREKNNVAFDEAIRNKSKQTPVTNIAKPVTEITTPVTAVVAEDPLVLRSAPASKNKELVQHAVVKTDLTPDDAAKEDKKSATTDKPSAEKNKLLQDQEDQHAKAVSNTTTAAIEKSLSVSTNDFKSGAFGGISGLKCTLINGSKLPLESVEVEVEYVQANNKIYKTEKILFKDISAGAQATVDAPASSRGVKIVSRIIKINRKETGLSNTTAKS